MKALKKLTLNKLLAGSVLSACAVMSAPVFADHYSARHGYSAHFYDGYNSRYSNSRRSAPVTLRLKYKAKGTGRIPLKRMLRNQHGIDPDNWRIRSVNVRHKSKRTAHARLNVGDRSTRDVYLRRGVTTIYAPRGRSDGRWVLGFRNAKVRDVAVTLEPRHSRRGDRKGKYRTQQRGYDTVYRENGNRNRYQRGFGVNPHRR